MKIALCGLGKAGMQVVRMVYGSKGELEMTAAFCRNESSNAGKCLSDVIPVKGLDCRIHPLREAGEVFAREKPDVLIDFSGKAATLQLLPHCARHGVRMVICTTGFSEQELELLKTTAEETEDFSLVYAPNITLGINVVMLLADLAAQCLPDYDFAITEKHHRKKADVSATAKKLAGHLEERLEHPVPVNSIRAGGYVGLHEVLAVGEFERITIIHESFSRQAFANGALIAARYLMGRSGYFEMKDIVLDYFKKQKTAEENS